MAAVITDVELSAMMNARLVPDAQDVLTPGAARAGMILPGLGVANRPLSCPPQVVANTPLARLCRAGLRADRLPRVKLGRTLDAASPDGGDLWWHAVALAGCAQGGLARRCTHLDTTSVALPGAYGPDSDEQAMTVTYGDSQAHRPDLKHAVLALMVAHDGGVPFGRKRGEGHTSAIKVFQARAQALLAALQPAPSPRALRADSHRYPADHGPHLQALGVSTRSPPTLHSVSQVLTQAVAWDTGQR